MDAVGTDVDIDDSIVDSNETDRGGLLVDQQIATLKDHIPNTEGRIAAIYRDGKSMQPDGDTVIREGDEIFFVAARQDVRVFMSEMRKLDDPVKRVIIAGGGNIGVRLAQGYLFARPAPQPPEINVQAFIEAEKGP